MPRRLMLAGALALIVGGCAPSAETERSAQTHDTRARQATAYADYSRATEEKREADRLHAKASVERAEEAKGAAIKSASARTPAAATPAAATPVTPPSSSALEPPACTDAPPTATRSP